MAVRAARRLFTHSPPRGNQSRTDRRCVRVPQDLERPAFFFNMDSRMQGFRPIRSSGFTHKRRVTCPIRHSIAAYVAIALLAVWPHVSRSQELAPVEAQTIAREAYIYGFPIVENYKTMYASAIDTDGEGFEMRRSTR